jgi:pilus assembly protein Flp/PilA
MAGLKALRTMLRDDGGATMVEYGLLIAFVAIAAMVGVRALGRSVSSVFSTAAGSV